MSRIGGKNFDVNLGDLLVHVESCTLDVTDNSAVAQTRGVPNGHVDGDVSASGEFELDSYNFGLLMDAARTAGSFRQLEPFDTVFFAKTGDDGLPVRSRPGAGATSARSGDCRPAGQCAPDRA